MSDFFITPRNAAQAELDAEFAPPDGEERNDRGFDVANLIPGPYNSLRASARFAGVDTDYVAARGARGVIDLGSSVSDLMGRLGNIPNNWLETPDYLLPEDPVQRAAVRRITDPHYNDRTAVARTFESIRDAGRQLRRAEIFSPQTPEARTEASQFLAGLAEVMTPALVAGPLGNAGGAAAMAFSTEERTYLDMLDRGVREEVARGAAIQDASFMAAMGVAPVAVGGTGRTLLTRILQRSASGAAINFAFGVGMRGSMNEYLSSEGYGDLAQEYQWFDTKAALIDIIMGAAFGGVFGHSAYAGAEGRTATAPSDGEVSTVEPANDRDLPEDPEAYFEAARQHGTDGNLAEAYRDALIARELGHPEADGLLQTIEEDATESGALDDLESGRAMAGEIVSRNLEYAVRDSELTAAAMVEAGTLREEFELGVPVDERSRLWGAETMDRAARQIENDERVDVGRVPDDVGFVARAVDDAADAHLTDAIEAFASELEAARFADVAERAAELRKVRPEEFDSPTDGALFSMRRRGVGAERGSEAFYDERLTPSQNKAVEMARNGYSNVEIADEMDTSTTSVSVLLNQAKHRIPGLTIPPSQRGQPRGQWRGRPTVTIEQIVRLYNQLYRQGYRNRLGNPALGRTNINTLIAKRLGLDVNNVAKRLHDYRASLARGEGGEPLFSMRPTFESAVERAVARSTTARASGDQWWATISKATGVKREELEWIGLEDWLKAQEGPVSREDLLQFVRENGVRVEETVLGGEAAVDPAEQARILPLIEEVDRIDREIASLIMVRDEGGAWGENKKATAADRRRVDELQARRDEIAPVILEFQERQRQSARASAPKWSQYTLPGGENYRELLLRLPVESRGAVRTRFDEAKGGYIAVDEQGRDMTPGAWETETEALRRAESEVAQAYSQNAYRSSHWDAPNILAHVRFNERTDSNGARTLFIEEVQSDWGAANRRAIEEITKPDSVRELADNIFGPEVAAVMSLEQVNGGVLATLHNDQIARAVVSRLSVDVVNDLGGVEAATQKLLSNDNVLAGLPSIDLKLKVANAIGAVTREIGAELRAVLSEARNAGRDAELVPALRASDLNAREVVGLLAPQSLYHVGLAGGAGDGDVAGTRAVGGAGARDAAGRPLEGDSAAGTDASGGRVGAGAAAETAPSRLARLNKELGGTSLASLLNWHSRIVQQAGGSRTASSRYLAAPFVDSTQAYTALAFKRMIRWGAENGFDQIAWTRGQHQVERFNIEKVVDRIEYEGADHPGGHYLRAYKNDSMVLGQTIAPEALPDVIGKELADRLLASSADQFGQRRLEGADLRFGGSGMRAFYDRILPNIANDLGKKFGARVGETEIKIPPSGGALSMQRTVPAHNETVHSLPITPEMRDQALEGQALFSQAAEVQGFSSVEELQAQASEILGADWGALSRAGKVEIVQSSADVPAPMGLPRGVQAVHMRDTGTSYFIANNIRPEDLYGLVLHEVGVHNGFEAMLGKRGFNEVLRQIERMIDEDHPAMVEARSYAERYAANDAHVPEETLAYLIETHADLPLVQRVLSRIRQWLIKTFGSTFGMRLTVDDLRALAITSLRRVAEQARRESAGSVEVFPLQEAVYASQRPDAGQSGGRRVVYRGLNRPYDPANGGYYQSFTSSLEDAREYGPNVMAAHINPGRNLAVDGGGNNFNAISVEQLPADVRGRLHPSVGQAATTDQIAHAAREAGYDSVTVRNVHDNRWGERPARGAEPRTIDFVFDTRNISPLDSVPQQPTTAASAAERVKLSDADRALLDELEADLRLPPSPDGGSAGGGSSSYVEQLRAEGFDPDKYWVHYTNAPEDFTEFRASASGRFGPGVYLTGRNAPRGAGLKGGEGTRAIPVITRGDWGTKADWLEAIEAVRTDRQFRNASSAEQTAEAVSRLEQRGINGIWHRDNFDDTVQLNVFNPQNVRMRFGRAPNGPNAGDGGDFPLFSQSRQNRENLLGARRDPIESPEYQARLRALRESDGGQGRTGEAEGQGAGGVRGVAGEPARSRAEQLRDILSVSAIHIKSRPEGRLAGGRGENTVTIDTPFAGKHDALLQAKPGADGGPTMFQVDLVDGSNPKDTRLPGVHLRLSRVNDGAQGAKVGIWVYRQLIEWADRQNLPFYSDDLSVSRDAQNIYDALKKRGYIVDRLGRPKRSSDGSLLATDGMPVYRVTRNIEIEEPLTGAPLPRDDYRIDDPSLRERQARIDEQRARQEAYDKLSPAEQALVDTPDLRMPDATGEPRKATEVIDEVRARAEAAKEEAPAIETAARCAARFGMK